MLVWWVCLRHHPTTPTFQPKFYTQLFLPIEDNYMITIKNIIKATTIATIAIATLLLFATVSYGGDHDAIQARFELLLRDVPHTGIVIQDRDGATSVTLIGVKARPDIMCDMFSGLDVATVITTNAGKHIAEEC